MNSFLCNECGIKKLTSCGCSANCYAEEGQEISEKSNCSSVIARDFKRIGSVTRKNQKRTRDREPSRIPVRRVPKVLKRKSVRQKMEQEVETTYKSAFFISVFALIKTLRDV